MLEGVMYQDFQKLTEFTLFSMGSKTVTVGSLFAALFIFVFALLAARFTSKVLRRVRGSTSYGRGMVYLVEKLITYGLVVVGIIAAFSAIGLNLSALAVFAGALGIGVGLGLQGIVKEFVSGLVLIFDRALNIGDFIELEDGRRGTIKEIGPRATHVRTNDNLHMLLPNSHLIEKNIVNWTMRDAVRRIHVPFFVAYGADKAQVRTAVLEAAFSVPFTLPDEGDRKTQVWLVGFGESNLKFELVVWPTLDACKRPAAMQAAYTWAIDDALRKAGIGIPYPQIDVRVREVLGRESEDALRALGLNGQAHTEPQLHIDRISTNDAAEDLQRHSVDEDADDVRESVDDLPPTGKSNPGRA
ncbi:MAG: mechanosensitive ion channel domain-containing protein [Caulobacterales bacterium]